MVELSDCLGILNTYIFYTFTYYIPYMFKIILETI